jgi:hypothetical protein
MSREEAFAAVDDLKGSAALSWAADCVEHLARQVGDTANNDIAACVRLARKYAQDRLYDSAAAHSLSKAARRARRRLSVGVGAIFGTALDVATDVELVDTVGWREKHRIERAVEPATDPGPSQFTRGERALKVELAGLLRAAEALCGADPHVAARDASASCRQAAPAEATWQLQCLNDHLDPPPSVRQETA